MANLATTYMGIPVSSPVVVAACSLSGRVENIQQAEAAGAGALVIKSLFEEQIMAESVKLHRDELAEANHFAESLTYFPPLEHAGPREHLMWVEKSRQAVDFPLIGSINAYTPSGWVEYARKIQDAGVDALELNVYAVQTDIDRTGSDVESQLFDTVQSVVESVSIPVSVKLSPYYSSICNVVGELAQRGVKGVVLFNRFLQPDINADSETLRNAMELSRPEEMKQALRYIALLSGKVDADLIAGKGIHSAAAVIKQLLAGAQAVQVASVLYMHDIDYLRTLNEGLADWMADKGYESIDDFRGNLSQEDVPDPYAFERAQYVELLLQQV